MPSISGTCFGPKRPSSVTKIHDLKHKLTVRIEVLKMSWILTLLSKLLPRYSVEMCVFVANYVFFLPVVPKTVNIAKLLLTVWRSGDRASW